MHRDVFINVLPHGDFFRLQSYRSFNNRKQADHFFTAQMPFLITEMAGSSVMTEISVIQGLF